MANFLYNPGIKVYIETRKHGIVDVTEDLISGTMVRRSDGVSTFDFEINNPQRVYDNVFTPNDRIVVLMKRLTWMRTFTGLLNQVPLFSAWPRPVSIRSSCSLKRLQYWYWDPYAPDSITMLNAAAAPTAAGATDQSNESVDHKAGDMQWGITNMALTVLDKVVGWPASKVHIAQIPPDWYQVAVKIARSVSQATDQADAAAQKYLDDLGATASVGDASASGASSGTGVASASGKANAGDYGGVRLSQSQCDIAYTIYSVAATRKLSQRAGLLGIMCGMQESTLRNLSGGDRDSVGVFQQRPSQGWGTVAQCTNVTYAAGKFFDALVKVSGWQTMEPTLAVQAVQRSGYPQAYAKWQKMAQALVDKIQGSGGSVTGSVGSDSSSVSGSVGSSTSSGSNSNDGTSMATYAVNLVKKYKISYSQATPRSMSYAQSIPPPAQDCSLFCGEIFNKVTGKTCWAGGPTTRSIEAWILAHGGKKISSAEGMTTPGAFMMIKGHHMEFSVGDGKHTVGSHKPGVYASVVQTTASYYDYALLAPGVSYQNHGTSPVIDGDGSSDDSTATSSTDTNPLLGQSSAQKYSETSGYDSSNPIDSLFGNSMWTTAVNQDQAGLALALSGVRALMNDQPMLPYITNLMNTAMRSLSSAPNGDLIAWFPDYYGRWNQAAIMVVQLIELMDFTVDWSDDSMVTHMYTAVSNPGVSLMDPTTGQWADPGIYPTGMSNTLTAKLFQTGIASIDIPAMMTAIFGIDTTEEEAEEFASFIYQRFGARPAYEEVPGLTGPTAELFAAIFKFMLYWGYQYNADVPMTFMPELWPGMLLQIPEFSFQCYVTTVTHTFDLGEGGGFRTTANVAAPAKLDNTQGGVFMGLPEAGGFNPTNNGTAKKSG